MKKYISKLLMGTISDDELIVLRKWIDDPQNRSTLESYLKDYHDLNLVLLKNDVDAAYSKVIGQIEKEKRPIRRLMTNWIKYAAVVMLFFGIAYLIQRDYSSHQDASVIVSNDKSITLELENGAVQTIDVSQTKAVKDVNGNLIGAQKQNQLSYTPVAGIDKLVFNTLTVPYGKRFELVLSDGTSVHLNAGSSLRYPMNFLKEGARQVFLTGEAYFDVKKNKSNPFVVKVGELEVNVLGTEFNVSAYTEDSDIEVVLVEGAVNLKQNNDAINESTNLVPGQKGLFEHTSNNISVANVKTALYTSWRQGHLVFRNVTFDNILAKLERHYSVEIENRNKELGSEIFNASFNDVEIEKVLSFFNDVHKIKYSIENNKVIIE